MLKISLVISLFGILILIYLSLNFEPELSSISDITLDNLNLEVKILGQIDRVRNYEQFSIIYIKNNNLTIQGLINHANFTMNYSQEYYFIGQVSEYNNTIQINLEKIIKKEV